MWSHRPIRHVSAHSSEAGGKLLHSVYFTYFLTERQRDRQAAVKRVLYKSGRGNYCITDLYYYYYFLPEVVKIPGIKNYKKKLKIKMSDGHRYGNLTGSVVQKHGVEAL